MKPHLPIAIIILRLIIDAAISQSTLPGTFTISGKTMLPDGTSLYLGYFDCSMRFKVDSSKVVNDHFYFKGILCEPNLAVLKTKNNFQSVEDTLSVLFFLEPSDVTAIQQSVGFKSFIFLGSKSNDAYIKNYSSKEGILKKLSLLEKKYNHVKSQSIKLSIENDYNATLNEILLADLNFIQKNPASFVSLYLLQFIYEKITLKELKAIFTAFPVVIAESQSGKKIKSYMLKLEAIDIGKEALDFSFIDLNGKKGSLNKFKYTNFLILDFWASWCKPCRQSFPELKQISRKYYKNGLRVISISTDENDVIWKKAIRSEKIEEWINIRSIVDSVDISELYLVNELPTKFLIDKKGVIVGRFRNTERKEFYEKLAELIKKVD